MSTKPRCPTTGLSVSFAYKMGCRCESCQANKAIYTAHEDKEKSRLRAKKWRAEHPERVRVHRRRHRGKDRNYQLRGCYGLTPDEFVQLQEFQNNRCAICGRGPDILAMSNSRQYLNVDHDHRTGKVCGLLCGSCNVGLGHFQHSPSTLEQAIIYLEEVT